MSLQDTEEHTGVACECEQCPCDNCEEECGSDCECVEGDCCYADSSSETVSADDDHNSVLRGKWIYSGSETIDDMIECLQREIKLLTDLKTDGWKLTQKVDDDYAFIRQDVPTTEEATSGEKGEGDDTEA